MNELFEQHLQLVIKANESVNLTRILTPEMGRILHIEDSLSALPELQEAPHGKYGDLGSGAGFPGIPLAIASQRETMLIESVKKKAKYLSSFCEDLGISNYVNVFDGRIEQLSLDEPKSFTVLTARALSSLGSLLELSSPLLSKKGRLICYKARILQDELDHAISLQSKLGMTLISKREFYLSDNETYRTILVFEKTSNPKIRLPRRDGMAQKNPL